MLEEAFTVSLCLSSGPDIGLFKKVQIFLAKHYCLFEKVQDIASDMIKFAEEQLQKAHSRDVYKALLELVILFLCSIPHYGIHFCKPDTMHRARWMTKLICSLKTSWSCRT